MRTLQVWLIALFLAVAGCVDDKDKDDQDVVTDPDTGDQNNTTAPPLALAVRFAGPYPVQNAYDPPTLTAPENTTVNVTFTNNDQNPLGRHDWAFDGVEGANTDVIATGASDSVTFMTPAAGTYAFYCSVPGHRDRGMEGTFTVTAAENATA